MSVTGETGSQLHVLNWADLGISLELTSSMKHEVATRVLEHRCMGGRERGREGGWERGKGYSRVFVPKSGIGERG